MSYLETSSRQAPRIHPRLRPLQVPFRRLSECRHRGSPFAVVSDDGETVEKRSIPNWIVTGSKEELPRDRVGNLFPNRRAIRPR